jgi:hypothetical protein
MFLRNTQPRSRGAFFAPLDFLRRENKKTPLKAIMTSQGIALGLMPDSGAITNYFALAPVLWGRGLFAAGYSRRL